MARYEAKALAAGRWEVVDTRHNRRLTIFDPYYDTGCESRALGLAEFMNKVESGEIDVTRQPQAPR